MASEVNRIVASRFESWLDYEPQCRYPEGFVLLYDADMKPLDWANQFMLRTVSALIRVGKDWRQTQKAEADDLAVLAMFLVAKGLPFASVEHQDLVEFAYILNHSISPQTQKKYAVNSVRRRLNTTIKVCEYGFQQGLLQETPIKYSRNPNNELILSARGQPVPEIIANLPEAPAADTHLAPITKANFQRILNQLGPAAPGAGPRRDRIIAELAATTGLREDEIANLTLVQILMLSDPNDLADHAFVPLVVTHTKGSREGTVQVPVHILKQILEYIEGERAEVVAAARALAFAKNRKFQEPPFLFLNGLQSNHRDIGRRCTKGNIGRIFTRAVVLLGLLRKEKRFVFDVDGNPVIDDQTRTYREVIVLVPAHSFHDLRHTFAVTAYYALKANGHRDPIRMLKAMLRHKLSQTTQDIYLRWLDTNEAELSASLSKVLRGLTAWYA